MLSFSYRRWIKRTLEKLRPARFGDRTRAKRRVRLNVEPLDVRLAPAITIALDPASDSGVLNGDNITNFRSPTFDVQVPSAGTLALDFDGNGTTDATRSVSVAGVYQFTSPVLVNGSFTAAASFVPTVGSPETATVPFTIATQAPRVLPPGGGPGTALRFDGVNDFVRVPDSSPL